MVLSFRDYKDKVKACWLGKNIGGTLGAPIEGYRGVYDLEYYIHDLSQGVLPNDDLDLQIVWLNAAERYGRNVNAEILGEHWISYIVADWSEYGAGKNNLAYGLLPPISGWYKNHNKDSCGCFIRSEIWACLHPGHPELAVQYAYEDAICDHAHEGMYAEIFCAALESAAFVEKDIPALIETGLAFLPKDCAVAGAVREALACHQKGLDWKQARKVILQKFPGSFGMFYGYRDCEPEPDVPVGSLGYDVPSNIGIMVIGLVYGEGDFSKSICIAAGCGEDADCTVGTLGAILGIIGGTACIDEKWLTPIGDEIKTISITVVKNTPEGVLIPKTVTELSKRVINLMPTFMYGHYEMTEEGLVFAPVDSVMPKPEKKGVFDQVLPEERFVKSPVRVDRENHIFAVSALYADESMEIREGVPKQFILKFENKLREQHWLRMKIHNLPEEWEVSPGRECSLCLNQRHGGSAYTDSVLQLTPHNLTKGEYRLWLEISINGRLSTMFVPLILFVGIE